MPQSELPIEVPMNAVKPRSTALELDLRLGPGAASQDLLPISL